MRIGVKRILAIEDDADLGMLMRDYFAQHQFGTEPANLVPPSPNVGMDSDGTRHAIISSPNEKVNSEFLISPNEETVGQPVLPIDFTRFRVTFMTAGTFNYICGIHDNSGMVGRVIVLP
jgi:hypothetical protein